MAKYVIMNDTDGIPAGMYEFSTKKGAKETICKMRENFKRIQGYYRTSRGERINPDHVIYRIVRLYPNPQPLF